METIFKRRSIRNYSDKKISDEDINLLLKAGMAAPSAHNFRTWEFIVVRSKETFNKIMEFHPYSKMLKSADACIVVCGKNDTKDFPPFWVQDCAAATENILLQATSLGIGSVWLGLYPIEQTVNKTKELFNIPENITPFCFISLGYPSSEPQSKDLWEEEKVHRETW